MEKKRSLRLKFWLLILTVPLVVLLGVLLGISLVYQRGLPQIDRLEDIRPMLMTTFYDDMGRPIKELAVEKRDVVTYRDIPPVMIQAVVASEDNQFFQHWGINFRGLARGVWGLLTHRRLGGGSSITQQVARNFFLTQEFSVRRKLQEMLLAIQIEKAYSKEQILTHYLNKIHFGGNIAGVATASRYYFGKAVSALTPGEAALLTAMIPSPSVLYNALRRPSDPSSERRRTLIRRRRDRILDRMGAMGFLASEAVARGKGLALPVRPSLVNQEGVGDFFVEDVRRHLERRYGDQLLYQGGLRVHTSMSPRMQAWAEEALREGLRELDKRRGFRVADVEHLPGGEAGWRELVLPEWRHWQPEKGGVIRGVVMEVGSREAQVRVGRWMGRMRAEDAAWARRPLRTVLKPGDAIMVRILELETKDSPLRLGLEQEPLVQGALLVVENRTGLIKALVGGYSFARSQWNNATQALRQTGSTFKPIVYAAALENGYTPATVVVDEPTVFENAWTQEPYQPQNHEGTFMGPITLRRGLERSVNVITAKLVEQLTPPKVVEYARRFGIRQQIPPYMSIALGSIEVTLIDMVGAYTVFPNLGYRVTPHLISRIEDGNGQIIEEHHPERKQVLRKEVAFLMNHLLQGVVQSGSGFRARHLKAPIGGKTGTTDGYTNAWFIGFSPSLTVGVWVGHEGSLKTLGRDETGSRAASPIFVRFMERYLAEYQEPQRFREPSGVVSVRIDRKTGKLLGDACLFPLTEFFVSGTEPTEFCDRMAHDAVHDYYETGEDVETD